MRTVKGNTLNIAFVLLTFILAACSSEGLPVQYADEYDEVRFGVTGSEAFSRVTYNSALDPTTMSVWGTYSGAIENSKFNNKKVEYIDGKWTYDATEYWENLPASDESDYFACMPYSASAVFDNSTKTISYPVTLQDGYIPAEQRPMFCNQPVRNPIVHEIIQFYFDQALSAYQLNFKLDDKMGAIRSFVIKDIKMTGNFTTSCTLSRQYTFSESKWTPEAIAYSDVQTADLEISVPYKNNHTGEGTSPYSDTDKTLRVTAEGYRQWGPTLCVLPNQPFTPKFEVTYDVVVQTEDKTDVVTRHNVTSTIIFNNVNFPTYSGTSASAGSQRPIMIQIAPKRLYVLADADQTAGYLLID